MNPIKHLSKACMNLQYDNSEISASYLAQNTTQEVREAVKQYDEWWATSVEQHHSTEWQNDAHLIIWQVVSAYAQFVHEDGVRTGVQFMLGAFEDTPTLHGIQFKRPEKSKVQ